jgi:hypothetical protein
LVQLVLLVWLVQVALMFVNRKTLTGKRKTVAGGWIIWMRPAVFSKTGYTRSMFGLLSLSFQ